VQKYINNLIYGVSKCATDRMVADMAFDLEGSGVTAVSVYPGIVRTERIMSFAEAAKAAGTSFLDLSNSESPQFTGIAIAHLLADPNVGQRNGQVLVSAELAREYGFTDIDGRQPRPMKLEDVPSKSFA
jgi:NAD(P)-dependent dehydrogenase (short-subunit alcohol dehydrogenase family)